MPQTEGFEQFDGEGKPLVWGMKKKLHLVWHLSLQSLYLTVSTHTYFEQLSLELFLSS